MDNRQALIYGLTGQTVVMYPTEGVPSAAATYSVWYGSDGNDQTAILTGTATMDTLSLTVTSASGYSQTDRKKINLTTTAGLTVGERYYAANESGQGEWLTVARVVTNTYAEATRDLAYDYSTSATVKGFKQSFTIDASFIATLSSLNDETDPYRVQWSYTVASVARRHWTMFDVVRGAWQHGVTIEDLAAYWPDITYADDRGEHGGQAKAKIEAASRRVQMDLRQRGIDPNTVVEGPIRDELVRNQTLCLYAREGKAPAGRDSESFRREVTAIYMRDIEGAVSSRALKQAQNKTGAITEDPTHNLWLRS
jgi:hypothetical protein